MRSSLFAGLSTSWILASALAASPAAAREFKPRILLVFDTSGSMGFNLATGEATGGDNSREYPGNGGVSRLSVAREVVSSLVQSTSEVELALMRYPQRQGAGINNGSMRGAFNSYQGLAQRPLNYAGECSGDLRAGADPSRAFSLLVPFRADNEREIVGWLDGQETYPADPELRAEGPTPIAESLRLARTYFEEVLDDDDGLRCRRNYVVVLTDGDESCVPPANDVLGTLLDRTLALRQLDVQPDAGPVVRKDVKVFFVGFAVTPRIVAQLDALAQTGGTAVNDRGEIDLFNGRSYSAADSAGLRRAFSQILAEAIPSEACNGLDDDCDDRVDEGVLNACGQCGGAPREVCNDTDDDCDGTTDEGVRNACGVCGPVAAEACNGADDDCDGAIDEAVVNACGGCAAVRPDICNGVDDDCDGRIDNVPGTVDPLDRVCGEDRGLCRAGVETCIGGQFVGCTAVFPTEEVCDGNDNDCNGAVDEASRACGPAVDIGNVGACRVGRQACVFTACQAGAADCDADGWSNACEGAVGPVEEVCNGLDDDCDSAPDEGLINACGQCGDALPEACNGQDDNCDGRIDEAAVCPRGYLCFYGACVQPCDSTGECGSGLTCVSAWPEGRFCHPDPCAAASCPEGTVCNAASRACEAACLGVVCGAGEACALGACVPETCRETGCPEGERCTAGSCVPDPCAGVVCGNDGFCRDGTCVAACRGVVCGPDRRCVDGACVPDPCGGRCLRGQRCDTNDGLCVEDPCARVTCPPGTACQDGACSDEAPCAHIDCPPGLDCVDGACTDHTPGVAPTFGGGAGGEPGAGGAGGGGGSASPGGESGMGGTPAPPVPLDAGIEDRDTGRAGDTPRTAAAEGCACDTTSRGPGLGGALFGLLIGLGLRRRRAR